MIKKKVTKTTTYKILEEKDVEEIMSKYVGREVKIDDVDFELMDITYFDNVYDYEDIEDGDCTMGCKTYVDGEEIVDPKTECSPLDIFMPNTPYVKFKYIFAFDVSKFKSFKRYTLNDW